MNRRARFVLLPTILGLLFAVIVLLGAAGIANVSLAAPLACTPGPHSGVLTADETWCATDSPHLMDGTVTMLPTVTLTIEPGTIIKAPGSPLGISLNVQGHLEAIGAPAQPISLTSTTGGATWGGLMVDGGTAVLKHTTVEYACEDNIFSHKGNIRVMNGGKLNLSDSLVRECHYHGGTAEYMLFVENSQAVISNTAFTASDHYAIYVTGPSSQVTLDGNLIHDNLNGVYLAAAIQATMRNNVFLNNPAIGVRVAPGATANMLHTTIAGGGTYGASPLPAGVYVENGGTAVLTNTIFSRIGTAVRVLSGGTVTMTNTLWDNNSTNVVGTYSETDHIDGLALFEPDGYHLTRYSAALGRGVATGATSDVDGDARPLPAGTAPDLGADETAETLDELVSEMGAFPPQWFSVVDPVSGLPFNRLRQRYVIALYYGSQTPNPPPLAVNVTDTLPAELAFESQFHSPPMDFTQQGQALTWQTQQPLPVNQTAQVLLSSLADNPEPGIILTNSAEVSVGGQHFNQQQSYEVPLFNPVLTTPRAGEICSTAQTSGTQVIGMAQGNAIVSYMRTAPKFSRRQHKPAVYSPSPTTLRGLAWIRPRRSRPSPAYQAIPVGAVDSVTRST